MELKYGTGILNIGMANYDSVRVLQSSKHSKNIDLLKELGEIRKNLIQTLILKIPRTVAIIVEDKTRVNPEYPAILSMLLDELQEQNVEQIFLVPAYGTHSAHTAKEHESLYGLENLTRVKLIEHNCHDQKQLTSVGYFTSGKKLNINTYVARADFLIVLGSVAPHTFAGFTGGRKAILPGIAGYDNIRDNHGWVVSPLADFGVLDGNPIHENMFEAMKMVNIDFAIQTVRNSKRELAGIFAGDIGEAFNKGVSLSRELSTVKIDKTPDVVIVGCGGEPKDVSLYQAQRAISAATRIVKPGGKIFVFGMFREGVGNDLLEEWLSLPLSKLMALKHEDIEVGVHSAYLLARHFSKAEFFFYTELEDSICSNLNLKKIDSMSDFHSMMNYLSGSGKLMYIIPDGSNILINVPDAHKKLKTAIAAKA